MYVNVCVCKFLMVAEGAKRCSSNASHVFLMHVGIFIYLHTNIYTYICAYIRTYIHEPIGWKHQSATTKTKTPIPRRLCKEKCTYEYVCMWMDMYVYMFAYICICYIYI